MSPQFHFELGPFSFTTSADENGITMQRGTMRKTFAWDSIAGAVLVRPTAQDLQEEEQQIAKAQKFFGGAVNIEEIKKLRGTMAAIHIGYRDERNRLEHDEIPVPIGDDGFLLEFRTRLGKRWLGEAADQHAAEKKLHTAPGFFKTVSYLFLILSIVGLIAAFGLYSLAAPALNFLSLRQMYLDLERGDFVSFGMHVFVYVALFALAYVLRRLWRNWRETRRSRARPIGR
jgi:hypothetical protein